jgi:hypothetical protein
MADVLGDGAPAPDGANADTAPDRRRPGRAEVSPDLIPLLRNPVDAEIPPDDTHGADHPRDDLEPAKGLAVGLLLAVPLWCVIALVIWWAVG